MLNNAYNEGVTRTSDPQFHYLEMDAENALLDGQVQGLVITFHVNERPLHGLAGILDWRFQGAISRCLQAGAITGAAGECVYLPIARHGETYHLILAGAGQSPSPGVRESVPPETVKAIQKNLGSLRLQKVAVSRKDFGNASDEFFTRHLKGVPLWIVS